MNQYIFLFLLIFGFNNTQCSGCFLFTRGQGSTKSIFIHRYRPQSTVKISPSCKSMFDLPDAIIIYNNPTARSIEDCRHVAFEFSYSDSSYCILFLIQ